MHRDAQGACRITDLAGHGNIGLRWRGVARRVVVDKDHRCRVQFQRPLHNLARIDGDMVQRAFGLFFIRDQDVFRVEEQDAELLGIAMRHHRVAIGQQGVPAGHDMPLHHAGARQSMRRRFDNFQFQRNGGSGTRYLPDLCDTSRQHTVEIAKMVDQRAGQRFDILPRDGAE